MIRHIAAFLSLCLLASPASAQSPAVERLRADLMGGASATQVLTQWCGTLGYAATPLVRAVRDKIDNPATPEVRALLKVGADETIGYRRVKLTCGDHVLSEADNWYVPSRLTPDMNKTLDLTDTSFGTVVRPLNFHRQTLETVVVKDPHTILRVRALLRTPDDAPFSLVVENYTSDLAVSPR
jgi:chorismate-pyruvate lyase